ncbi:prepilin-type N-terminal cleavage/methylation domain-containing protein [Desulfolithobacter sp.]
MKGRRLSLRPWFSPGFTLLEVMVAVAIIAIALVTLIGSQSQSVSLAGISRITLTASQLAREKFAELVLAEADNRETGSGRFDEPFADYSWQVDEQRLDTENLGFQDPDTMLQTVDIVITRGDPARVVYQARTVLLREPSAGSSQ